MSVQASGVNLGGALTGVLHHPAPALGIKTVETRSWTAPALLVGQSIAVHTGWR